MNTRSSLWAKEDETAAASTTSKHDHNLPFFLDPGTKGGALTWMAILFVVPITLYNVAVSQGIMTEVEAGRTIGIGFTAVSLLAWLATLLVRIANKDMTYAKQLKNYEDAVLAKRLEELDEDEVTALVEATDDRLD